MFESKDLEKGNLTSTKKADELDAMLAMAEDISLEENTMDDIDSLTRKSPIRQTDETIRNVRMVSDTEEEYLMVKSQVEELNAQLDGRDKIIAKLRRKIKALEEKTERCVCKKKRSREKSQEKSYQGQDRTKSSRISSREGSFQKRNK